MTSIDHLLWIQFLKWLPRLKWRQHGLPSTVLVNNLCCKEPVQLKSSSKCLCRKSIRRLSEPSLGRLWPALSFLRLQAKRGHHSIKIGSRCTQLGIYTANLEQKETLSFFALPHWIVKNRQCLGCISPHVKSNFGYQPYLFQLSLCKTHSRQHYCLGLYV